MSVNIVCRLYIMWKFRKAYAKEEKVYKINKDTLMIINENTGYYRTRVIEKNGEFRLTESPLQIIESSCTKYGAAYEGRRETVNKILNSKTKLPIPVHPKKGIYLMPTRSFRNEKFSLISFFHVKKFIGIDKKTYVTFENNLSYYVSITALQFDLQMKRTGQVIAYFHRLMFLDYLDE